MKSTSMIGTGRWLSAALVGVLLCAGTAYAQHLTQTSHVPETVANGQAVHIGELPADQVMTLAISLPLRNQAQLDDLLQRLYNPLSSDYRQYLSVQEFADQFGPTQDNQDALIGFAKTNGLSVTGVRANRLVLDVEGTVADIEHAFHVTLGVYQLPGQSRTFFAPDREPTVDLEVPLLHITGLDNFILPQAKMVTGPVADKGPTGSGPHGQFVGSDIRAAYYGSGPLTGAGQSVGLFEFAGYEISDVQRYFESLNQPFNVPVVGVSVNGAHLDCPPSKCDDSEQVLDIEMAASVAPGLSQIAVYVGHHDPSILAQMAADNTSKQLSCSWGWADNETTLDPVFQEFEAQGQSFFVATGDGGSSTPGSTVWPADDPYVIAVGGTDLTTNGPGGTWKSETGWNGSAGMPSKNGIPIPSYQQLPGVINSSNGGSTTLRNIPDVAGEADVDQYSCYDGACYTGNGGTSYASPVWAAFTAMINERSLANGGPTVGFINPAIYAIGVGSNYDTDFHDIVRGSNGKYTSVVGYDLVTGWGSMIGPKLIKALVGK